MLEQFVQFAKPIHKLLYKLLVIADFKLYLLLREKFRTCPQFCQSRMETVPLLMIENLKGGAEEDVTEEERRTFQWPHFFQVKSFLDRTHKLYSRVFEATGKTVVTFRI